jgi:hypothetical protein
VTPAMAKARVVVRLPDGRTGRLIYWPLPKAQRRHHQRGASATHAKVQLPSGAILTVSADTIQAL